MNSRRDPLTPPSPLLPEDQVTSLLFDALRDIGAAGGRLGGRVRSPLAGRAGASGGRVGGRLGARLFTRTQGAQRTLDVPLSPETFGRLHGLLVRVFLAEPEAGRLAGLHGSGAMNMNPCVVQAVWQAGRLHLTAHAREGLIRQRTAQKALDRCEETLNGLR